MQSEYVVVHRGNEVTNWRTVDGACHSPTRDGREERDEFIERIRSDPQLFEQLNKEERWQAQDRVAEYKRNHPIRTIADLNHAWKLRHLTATAVRDQHPATEIDLKNQDPTHYDAEHPGLPPSIATSTHVSVPTSEGLHTLGDINRYNRAKFGGHSMTTEQRAKLVADLAEVREKMRIGTARYLKIATEIKAKRLEKDNLRGRIRNADERISAHYDTMPRAVDYLPEDPECVAWSKEHEQLKAERQALVDEIRAINSEQHTQEAIQYESPHGLLASWQLAEGNLLAALERDADQHRSPFEKGEISSVH
jgi:hypothetical protein